MSRRVLGIGLIVLLLLFAGVAYLGFKNRSFQKQMNKEIVGPVFKPPPSKRPDGFVQYKNSLLHFSIYHPGDLVVKEFDDGTAASTITFEASDGKGFQIFVIPYASEFVTEAQIKKDIPSGVVKEKTDIVVGGVPATMFFSTVPGMGDTREVWFIHGGFLYEVNTYKQLDGWLSEIMSTWEFL